VKIWHAFLSFVFFGRKGRRAQDDETAAGSCGAQKAPPFNLQRTTRKLDIVSSWVGSEQVDTGIDASLNKGWGGRIEHCYFGSNGKNGVVIRNYS